MKVILIISDGIADQPLKELGGKTPLQMANKPAMDEIARTGVNGIMDSIAPGIPAGSDTAHLAILGYDPYKTYEGRGAFEALGAGLEVKPKDVSFRGNIATVDKKWTVLDRRAGRIREDAKTLIEAVKSIKLNYFPEIHVIIKHTIEHRCAIVLRGPRLARNISDTDPHKANQKIAEAQPLDDSPEALRTAHVVNLLSSEIYTILNSHPLNMKRREKGLLPANAILMRGAGIIPKVKPLTEIYGINALAIAAGALYKGVCNSVGMDVINVDGATGDYETNTLKKAKAAIENLPKYDFILIHIKATDNASHDGDIRKKIKMIEKVDQLVRYLIQNTDPDQVIIALTADHTTSTESGEHTGDSVPISIRGKTVRVDSVQWYSEIDCAQGGLGRIKGVNLLPILMDLAGKSKKFGE
jgi:2,3-bisphosphoglycerate-independent phosphoglycerate mutase